MLKALKKTRGRRRAEDGGQRRPTQSKASRHSVTLAVFAGYCPGGVVVNLGERRRLQAKTTVLLRPEHLGRTVAVAFEDGDEGRPVVTGLVLTDEDLARCAKPKQDVVLDGETVRLTGGRELELRCGDAALTLRADGRVMLRGQDIHSRASRENRIKGGSVKIN